MSVPRGVLTYFFCVINARQVLHICHTHNFISKPLFFYLLIAIVINKKELIL